MWDNKIIIGLPEVKTNMKMKGLAQNGMDLDATQCFLRSPPVCPPYKLMPSKESNEYYQAREDDIFKRSDVCM